MHLSHLRVKFILPALTEATSPYWRPIKYSLFPPLGLATLAAYLAPDDEAVIVDEHVRAARRSTTGPTSCVIQVYITNAYRAYRIADHYRARGAFVALGGLHVTSLPDEAAAHADAIFLGPGEQTFPQFLDDFRAGRPQRVYRSTSGRTLDRLPPIRRDLIARRRYLVPNSIVVTRGCPQHCDFCYKDAFFDGRPIVLHAARRRRARRDRRACRAAISISSTIICSATARFAAALFDGMRGMNRLFQGAATVDSDSARRSDRAGRGGRTAQPLRRVRDADAGQPRPQQQAPEPGPRLQGGDRPAARPRHHDQRQLRLRHGRRRRGRVPANGRLGDRARHHDGDVPHPDAVSGHEAVRADGAGRPHRDARLGPVRHAARRLPARAAEARGAQGRVRLGVPGVLSVVVDRAGVAVARHAQAPGEALLLCRGLEEVRAALGRRDSRPAASRHDAAARSGALEGDRAASAVGHTRPGPLPTVTVPITSK